MTLISINLSTKYMVYVTHYFLRDSVIISPSRKYVAIFSINNYTLIKYVHFLGTFTCVTSD